MPTDAPDASEPPEPAESPGPPDVPGPTDASGPPAPAAFPASPWGRAADGDAGRPEEDGARTGESGLSGRDRAVLALERRPWSGPGAKERAIRERLGMSPTRYYQVLNALIDDRAATAYDPVTLNRLRRIRQSHRDTR